METARTQCQSCLPRLAHNLSKTHIHDTKQRIHARIRSLGPRVVQKPWIPLGGQTGRLGPEQGTRESTITDSLIESRESRVVTTAQRNPRYFSEGFAFARVHSCSSDAA